MSNFYCIDVNSEVKRIYKKDNISIFADFDFLLQPVMFTTEKIIHSCEVLPRVIAHSGELYNSADFFDNIDDDFIKTIMLNQLKLLSNDSVKQSVLYSYNLPISALEDTSFVNEIIKLSQSPIALEIYELDGNFDSQTLHKNIQALKFNGHQVWLDDFIYENVSFVKSLTKLKWDLIKIDESYLINPDRFEKLYSIIDFLKHYSSQIVIKGIENHYHMDFIKNSNLLAQGYYISPGVKVSELSTKILDQSG